MRRFSIINILTITFCLTNAIRSAGQLPVTASQQKTRSKTENNLQYDSSKSATISFNPKSKYPFDNTYKTARLTQKDFIIIDSLQIACVTEYNNSLDKEHKQWSIDLNKHNYKRQIIAVTNKSGEKEVWVNCFCRTWDNRWKTEIMIVDDGGNCYFNFKINLAAKKFYELGVNGGA
jgi:hypothetical protein